MYNSLNYLLKVKFKGNIRKLFSKFSSGLITVLLIFFILAITILMINVGNEISDKGPFEILVMIFLGFSTFMIASVMFQKRTAVLDENDANLLLTGPFNNKTIMTYILINSLSGAMIFGLMSYAYSLIFFGAMFEIKALDYLSFFIATFVLYYFFFSLIDVLYVRLMNSPYQSLIKRLLIFTIILIIVILFGIYYLQNPDVEIANLFLNFVMDDHLFNYVPIIGWLRVYLIGFHELDIIKILAIVPIIILCIVLTYLIITTKEIDPEKILDDAMYVKQLKEAKASGNNLNMNLKVHSIKEVSFKTKSGAIASRLMLDMRKTNSFITKQEMLLIALYLVISIFNNYGFAFYTRYVTIILMIITMNSNYADELKHHYIYLIPDHPIKKLLSLLWPTLIKTFIVILVMALAGLAFKPSPLELISGFLEMGGYSLIFISANIWSFSVLKSSTSPQMMQFIKMFIFIIAIIPSVIIGFIFGIILNPALFSIASSITNIVVAIIFILLSKGVVSGIDLMSE